MPAVAFHTGLADKLAYACRLTRKALRQGARLRLCGDAATLARLDLLLWTFEPGEFIAHARVRSGEPPDALLVPTTSVWLAEPGAPCPACDTLVNLGPQAEPGAADFAKVVELVSSEPDDRAAGRQRWRHYESTGWTITHHVAGGHDER